RWRHGCDVIPRECAPYRLVDSDVIIHQIFFLHGTAEFPNSAGQSFGNLTVVEIVDAIVADQLKSMCQIFLYKSVSFCEWLPFIEEYFARSTFHQFFLALFNGRGEHFIDREPILGDIYCGFDQLWHLHCPPCIMSGFKPLQCTGDTDGSSLHDTLFKWNRLPIFIEEHIRSCTVRSPLPAGDD